VSPDPLPLAQALIRCASVTPVDAGAQEVLAEALGGLGFTVSRLRHNEVANLFARVGSGRPHFCFAGHTDVVPPGAAWSADPFAAVVRDGVLYGRGACDMKGAIAAFVAAVARHLQAGPPRGTISLVITGDEEGAATDGTVRILEWMQAAGERPDFCLVGEPSNPERLGEAIKIGRRGSLNARITVRGVQGHVAYPARVDNPVHRLLAALAALSALPLDAGSEWFEPSTLQVTSIDVGNPVTNLVPATAHAALNIRFNDLHRGRDLIAWLRAALARHARDFELEASLSGESFLTQPGPEVELLATAIAAATGVRPRYDTGGGTSDARFLSRLCPVAEFGLVGRTMHKVDECVPLADLEMLAATYRQILTAFLP
jgi:succinyl-diaminopimelate desuccinylase